MTIKSIYKPVLFTICSLALASCELSEEAASTSTTDLEIDGTTVTIHTTRGVEYFTPQDNEGQYSLPTDPTEVSLPLAIRVMTEEVNSKIQNTSEYTCYDYTWNPEKLRLSKNECYVYAWYPTDLPSNEMIDVTTPKIVTRQSCFDSEETSTIDYIYGQGVNAITGEKTVSADTVKVDGDPLAHNNNHIKMVMKHALTKIHVQIQREATYTGKGMISALEVITEDNKVCNTAKMNVKTGEISNCTANNNVIRWEIPEDKIVTDSLSDYYALTIPIPNGEQRPIKFALVDGNDYIESVNLKDYYGDQWTQNYLAWEPGNEYIYIIRLRGRQLKVKVVGVEDYEDVDANGDDDWIDIEPNKEQDE